MVEEVAPRPRRGRPVLVGTLTIAESERLAARLREQACPATCSTRRTTRRRRRIVAAAGAPGAVTISTNMAGRGTDIRLGGPPRQRASRVVALGGLYIIGTNRHESRRVDLQLRGRAGRQGDPGETRFFVSLEDPLLVRFGLSSSIPAGPARRDSDAPIDSAGAPHARSRAPSGSSRASTSSSGGRSGATPPPSRTSASGCTSAGRRCSRREAPDVWCEEPERYAALVAAVGEHAARRAEAASPWPTSIGPGATTSAFVAELREGIHLVSLGGQDPLSRFKVQAAEAFRACRTTSRPPCAPPARGRLPAWTPWTSRPWT